MPGTLNRELIEIQQEFAEFVAAEGLDLAVLPTWDKSSGTSGAKISCGGAIVLGGLAIVGESMLYAAASVANPLTGAAALPVYALAVMNTNEWILGKCQLL